MKGAGPGLNRPEPSARMVHPGPRAAVRVQAVRTALRPLAGILPAGRTVMEAVAALMDRSGCRGGMLFLDRAVCEPFRYVLPALSTDGLHAAWYSDTIAPAGTVHVRRAIASLGQRDGAAFLHCHGTWAGADGVERMGHMLPLESVLAADAPVRGIGCDAWFEALPDEETAFTLFQPQVGEDRPHAVTPDGAGRDGGARGILARLRPAEDAVTAIESLCAAQGIADARVHGLGSIDHIRFAQGRRVDCLATELRLDGAVVRSGRAHLPIEVVDIDGAIHTGTLTRGDNPVGVTMEILIEPQERA